MHLKKIDISGFKSFADKTSITFPDGVTSIVGPNGCGKSNIVDAMRWVMGEQSLKQLRGKNTEDIIFAGSDNKPPVNLAEVSLLLSNEDGKAPAHLASFTEIEITRRIYRSGESVYMINRQPCRLKDIQELFATTGMGSRSYSVVQQGNIGAITDADPSERRVFIEEAAGILLYKARKKEALRKIEQTKQNLDRLQDTISEIDRQRTSLKRQAKAAEKYHYLKSAIQELDVRIQKNAIQEYQTLFDQTQKLLVEVQDTETAHGSQLQQLDAELESIQLQRTRDSEALSQKRGSRHELHLQTDRAENELAHATKEIERLETELKDGAEAQTQLVEKHEEMAKELSALREKETTIGAEYSEIHTQQEAKNKVLNDLSAELTAQEATAEQLRTQYTDLIRKEAQLQNTHQTRFGQKESLKRRLQKNAEELVRATQQLQAIIATVEKENQSYEAVTTDIQKATMHLETSQKELTEKETSLRELVTTTQKLDLDIKGLKTQYHALKRMEDNHEGYQKGTKNALHIAKKKEIDATNLMADLIQPEEGYEKAIEASVGHLLQYIVINSQDHALSILEDLLQNQNGRAGFIIEKTIVPAHAKLPDEISADQRLIEHMTISDDYQSILYALLGHIVVAVDIHQANALHQKFPQLYIVTQTGFFLPGKGILLGGDDASQGGLLSRKQELRQLDKKIQKLEVEYETAVKQKETFEAEVRALESNYQQLFSHKVDLVEKQRELDMRLYRVKEDEKRAKQEKERLQEEQASLKNEDENISATLLTHEEEVAQMQAEINTLKETLARQSLLISQTAQKIEELKTEHTRLKIRETELHAQLENTKQAFVRTQNYIEDTKERQTQLESDLSKKTTTLQQLKNSIETTQVKLKENYDELKNFDTIISEMHQKYQEIETHLQEGTQKVSSLREERQKIQEKIHQLELEQAQRQVIIENIHSSLGEKYNLSLEELWAHIAEKSIFDDSLAKDVLAEKIQRHRKHIERIGSVNLNAMQEYEEISKRYDNFIEQQQDLLLAMEDLQKLVRKINRITQERFMEKFELINQKFGEVFSRLFSGGTAQLLLTEPNKPLETGVELMISPPGKKVSRLSLLSGGEKALSAIAFIFSIFLLQPTGFCIMDEIDAPLDDVNVTRFNELLNIIGEHSQIIMITHNKRSMEFADMLVGVTMEQKGISKIVSVQLQSPSSVESSAEEPAQTA